jgi:lipopolysaccharide exporter
LELEKTVVNATRWTSASMLGRAMLYFAQITILARLLAPEDFGLMAIVISLTTIFSIVSDFGISKVIFSKNHFSPAELSNLYWLNIVIGALIFIIVAASAPLIAKIYGNAKIASLLIFSATIVPINTVSSLLKAIAEKKLAFASVSIIELIAMFVGVTFAIVSAWFGAGVYSIALGAVATSAMSTILVVAYLSNGVRPKLTVKIRELRDYLTFGAHSTGEQFINNINGQLDILLAGLFFGDQLVGIFSVPKNLLLKLGLLVNSVATRVGLPAIASVRNDRVRIQSIYLKTIAITSFVNFPIFFFILFFAENIVSVFLGEGWESSVIYFQIFSIWAAIRSTGNPVGSLAYALGRARLIFYWNVCLTGLFFLCYFLGLYFYGAVGLAISMLILQLLIFILLWRFLIHPLSGIRLVVYANQFVRPVLISAISAWFANSLVFYLESDFIKLTAGSILMGVFYLLLSLKYNKGCVDMISSVIGKRKHL